MRDWNTQPLEQSYHTDQYLGTQTKMQAYFKIIWRTVEIIIEKSFSGMQTYQKHSL